MSAGSASSSSAAAFRASTQSGYKTFSMNRHHPSSSSAAGSSTADNFTPEMRDRQSRGKDPYRSGDASDASDTSERESGSSTKLRLGGFEKEDFGKTERREKAVAFLDSPELLMMYAQSTGDTIPAARLHFMKMMCGYDEDSREDSHHKSSGSSRPLPRRDTDKRRGGDRAAGR